MTQDRFQAEVMDELKMQEVTYEQPAGWIQKLESEVDGKKVIRYTFTRERIGANDIPIYFSEDINYE